MAKKKSRKQSRAPRTSKPQGFDPGRYYRHNRDQIRKVLLYAAGGVVAIVLIWAAYHFISTREVTLTKGEYIENARRSYLLGDFPDAVLNYHRALNADPNDKILQRENYLARARDDMGRGGSLDLVLAAARQLISDSPSSILGRVSLAQLLEMRGDVVGMHSAAAEARQLAIQSADTLAMLVADLSLATFHRTKEAHDSAFIYGAEALHAAQVVGDQFHIALASAGLGFAAIRVDSLERARAVFDDLLRYEGQNSASYHDVANAGLADYYHRLKEFDSAQSVLGKLSHVLNSGNFDGTTAYSLQMYGRLLRDMNQLDSAVSILQRSLDIWGRLRSKSDLVDNLNDLARTYRLKDDYFNARKNYMAGGALADHLGLTGRNLYTADLNLLFLKNLKPEAYVQAGEEGKALADRYAGS